MVWISCSVIDGTKSMDFVMDDVKARIMQLAVRIRKLVPIARVGAVVFGGKGEAMDIQPLTLSTVKLQTFLGSIPGQGRRRVAGKHTRRSADGDRQDGLEAVRAQGDRD